MEAVDFEAELKFGKSYLLKENESVGTWVVEGYASTSDLDAQRHIVDPEAIKMGAESLKRYDTVLFNHDPNRPIGKLLHSEATDGGLLIKVAISKTEPKIWEQVKDGTLSKFSIRGQILDSEVRVDELTKEETFVIKGMELHEVSLVSVPANPHARSLAWYIEKALEKKKTYRQPGESLQDCVSRKIAANIKDGMPPNQAKAAAYSMCGESKKADDMEKKDYPWDQCIADQKAKGYSDARAKKICSAIKNRTVRHMVEEWGVASGYDEAIDFVAEKMENDKLYEYAWEKYLELQDSITSKKEVKKDQDNFEEAIGYLQAGLENLQGEDKDQVMSIIRSLQALVGRVYAKSIDTKGGQEIVADNKEEVKKEADEVKKEEEVKKSEEEPKKEEVKKDEEPEKVSLDLTVLKDVITQLQTMVKEVTTQSDTVKTLSASVGEAKTDIEKMLGELTSVMKQIPIRKGQAPEKEQEERHEEKAITETDKYIKAKPFDQLHMLIEKAAGGK